MSIASRKVKCSSSFVAAPAGTLPPVCRTGPRPGCASAGRAWVSVSSTDAANRHAARAGACMDLHLAGDEELRERRPRVLHAHQPGEEQDRTAWAVIHHQMLGLPGGVAVHRDDHAGGLALDLTGVF